MATDAALQNLTQDVARCVSIAGGMAGYLSLSCERLRDVLAADMNKLGRLLDGTETRAVDGEAAFMALLPHTPEPAAGEFAPTCHGLAVKVCRGLLSRVLFFAANDYVAGFVVGGEWRDVEPSALDIDSLRLCRFSEEYPKAAFDRLAACVADEGARALRRLRDERDGAQVAAGGNGKVKAGTPGRKPDEGKYQKARRLCERWERARGAGVKIDVFCIDEGIRQVELIRAQDLLRKRKSRGNSPDK